MVYIFKNITFPTLLGGLKFKTFKYSHPLYNAVYKPNFRQIGATPVSMKELFCSKSGKGMRACPYFRSFL